MFTATVSATTPFTPKKLTIFVDQKLNKQQDLGVKVATPVGTLCGQLLFGWLADVLGRKKMCKSDRLLRLQIFN